MEIEIITNETPITPISKASPKTKLPATPTPAAAAAPAATAATAPPAMVAPPAAPVQSEAAAVSTATATLDSTYTTTVGGKTYSADVSQSNGTYTLAVPGLPDASVSGSTLSEAEIALGVKIDTLV